MKTRILPFPGLFLILVAILFIGACAHKQVATAPPPPPPAPAKPTASLDAAPASVQRGQSIQLTWDSQNATDVILEGIGPVSPKGSRAVTPSDSTTYTLTAKGPGGMIQATARVTVTAPPVAVVPAGPSDSDLFKTNVKDVFFDYDKYQVSTAETMALQADASFLKSHPNYKLLISGHCDERGSEEYNMALGSNRANTVRDELAKLGVSPSRVRTVSYGKEKPFCSDEKEQCWQLNRRAHFTLDQ